MGNYKVTAQNKTSQDKSMIIFAEAPKVNAKKVRTNVIMSMSSVPPGNSVSFVINGTTFAFASTSKTLVTSSELLEVNIDGRNKLAPLIAANYNPKNRSAKLQTAGTKEMKDAGGFTIKTNPFEYPTPNDFKVGLGFTGSDGANTAVATWPAEPSSIYSILPSLTYYIAAVDEIYEIGQEVSKDDLGATFKLDYGNGGKPEYTLYLNKENQFQQVDAN